ncbi:MAG TPA: SsrA-binding protein SmpB [Flavobacteriales bacterium]|nr:SsrA-binding protein SmpB [Flavobacteriales bacterium]
MSDEVNIRNKRASHEYEFLQKYTAGMQLLGTEIKSIRAKEANLRDAHCTFIGGELWVKNLQISEYSHGGMSNHQPKRDRKLLLNARELDKLFKGSSTKGLAIIPLRLFIGKRGFAKLEIALAKGKKLYDKREDLKKKDVQREIDRSLKS